MEVQKSELGELYHHGILGMKWGIRRFQSYSVVPRKSGKGGKEVGSAKPASSSGESGGSSSSSAQPKKSRSQKAAEAKAAHEEREQKETLTARHRRKEVDRLMKSGTATELYNNRDKLTTQQMRDAINRLNTEKTLKEMAAAENPSQLKKTLQKLDAANDLTNKVFNYYSTGKKITNEYKGAKKKLKDKEKKDFLKNATLDEVLARSKDFSAKDLNEWNQHDDQERKLRKKKTGNN